MIKLNNYFLAENENEWELVVDKNAEAEKEFNGLYIVFENGKMFAETELYKRGELPEYIFEDIDTILNYVHKCGDDITVFDGEVENYLKNNGYSIRRTSDHDFGRYLYD